MSSTLFVYSRPLFSHFLMATTYTRHEEVDIQSPFRPLTPTRVGDQSPPHPLHSQSIIYLLHFQPLLSTQKPLPKSLHVSYFPLTFAPRKSLLDGIANHRPTLGCLNPKGLQPTVGASGRQASHTHMHECVCVCLPPQRAREASIPPGSPSPETLIEAARVNIRL